MTPEKQKPASRTVRKKVKRPAEIEDDPRDKGQDKKSRGPGKEVKGARKEAKEVKEVNKEASLIARSCGFVISASTEDIILQREEREREAREAKARWASRDCVSGVRIRSEVVGV